MSTKDYPIKFSNEIYATKKDVKDEMKTPLIDGIWRSVLEYRTSFMKTLKLRHITSSSYSICLTPKIVERITSIERKMTRLMSAYSRLERTGASYYFDRVSKIEVLKTIAKLYSININDTTLESLINRTLINVSPEYFILQRYLKCIELIENNPIQEIDDNTIGYFYSELLGSDDLTEYYRTNEVDNRYSNVVIDKLYLGVPCSAIEKSMDDLLNFIQYSDVSPFVKAICALYFMYYVRPFSTHSEDIAILMVKKILAYNDFDKVAALINFESLLENKDELENVLLDCQRYGLDLTYFLMYCVKKVEVLVEKALDQVAVSQRDVVKKDLYQPEPVQNDIVSQFTSNRINETFQNKTPLQPVELATPLPQEEVVAPSFEEAVVTESKPTIEDILASVPEIETTSQLKLEPTPVAAPQEIVTQKIVEPVKENGIAIANFPAGLTEEEAARLENHLLEMNPNFTRGQAYFYARHCTIGMCYTISQYKKEVGCAYETARNSMDNLVVLGYYRKEQLKNKYIYTPVKRG